jgi:hypothetical protein
VAATAWIHRLMFYSDDIVKLEKFNKDKPVTERDNGKQLLQEMANYADSWLKRRTKTSIGTTFLSR